MNQLETAALNAAEAVAPDSIAVEAAVDAVNTAANPSPEAILADIQLAIKLIKKLKALSAQHAHVADIVKAIF